MRGTLRVGVVDDHPLMSAGVAAELAGQLDLNVICSSAVTVDELMAGDRCLDVVLLDVRLDDESEPEANVARLTEHGWKVLLYTQERRPAVLGRCFLAGALGMVDKHDDPSVLAKAVQVAAGGEPFLSADWAAAVSAITDGRVPELAPREAEVLKLYAAGLPMKSVARRVGIAEETAKEYLSRVREKYLRAGRPAPTKTDLYVRAVEDGLLPNPADP